MNCTYFVAKAKGRLKIKDNLDSLESAKTCLKSEIEKEYDEISKLGGIAIIHIDPDEKRGYIKYWMPHFGKHINYRDYSLGMNVLSGRIA